jgi:hypothetical protein
MLILNYILSGDMLILSYRIFRRYANPHFYIDRRNYGGFRTYVDPHLYLSEDMLILTTTDAGYVFILTHILSRDMLILTFTVYYQEIC